MRNESQAESRTEVDRREPEDPALGARAAAEAFRRHYGRQPDAVFAAPGRVNLMGEHTDYNRGLCLPIALPYATFVAAGARPEEGAAGARPGGRADRVLRAASGQREDRFEAPFDRLGPGQVGGWPAYVAGVVWALGEQGLEVPGLDLAIESRVPTGAGLSSSAALECAVALACCFLAGVEVDDERRADLVQACIRAETEVAGAPTGGLDQTVSLFARPEHAIRLDCDDWSRQLLRWDPEAHGAELVVIDTRAHHTLTDGGYGSRRAECERAAELLGVRALRDVANAEAALDALTDPVLHRRARHVLTEIARVTEAAEALGAGDVARLGRIFDASHVSLRDDFEVSCVELDTAVAVAVEQGALGARMTGGGFGGSAIALVPASRVGAVEQAVAEAFAAEGWTPPQFLSGHAAAGARQIESNPTSAPPAAEEEENRG